MGKFFLADRICQKFYIMPFCYNGIIFLTDSPARRVVGKVMVRTTSGFPSAILFSTSSTAAVAISFNGIAAVVRVGLYSLKSLRPSNPDTDTCSGIFNPRSISAV